MEAPRDIVKAGKASYIGASCMYAWQFSKTQHTARVHSWSKFVSMQNFMVSKPNEPRRNSLASHSSKHLRWRTVGLSR